MCRFEFKQSGNCLNPEADAYCLQCKKPCKFETPLTNGDKLRRMNNEDIAYLFANLFFSSEKQITSAEQMFLSWLQEAAE